MRFKTVVILILFAQAVAFAAAPASSEAESSEPIVTELEILRRSIDLTFLSSSRKESLSKVGPLTTVIRMHTNGISARSAIMQELKDNKGELLVLQSENGSRCFIPEAVVKNFGFSNIEEFRVYLDVTDVARVRCVVDLERNASIASSLILYYPVKGQRLLVKPEAKLSPTVHALP